MKLFTAHLCLLAMIFVPGIASSHYINVDGDDSDWIGTSPGEDNFVYSRSEAIWKDAEGDDSGDGGDAPLADDNPLAYTYPTDAQFLGTEADLLEFRITVDDNPDSAKIFFLIRVDYEQNWMPFIGILLDIDHVSGSGETDCGAYSDACIAEDNAWEYAIYLYNTTVDIVDSNGDPVPGYHTNYFSSENDLIEAGIDAFNLSPSPLGEVVYCTVFTGLQDFDHLRDVNYDHSQWAGGGGLDDYINPKIYDLAFVRSSDQPNDLNNYSNTEKTIIRSSTVRDIDLSRTTSVQFLSWGKVKAIFSRE
jgi:hypothetical protein